MVFRLMVCLRLSRDSRDERRASVNFCAFLAFWQDRPVARAAAPWGSPNDRRAADLAIFAGIWMQFAALAARDKIPARPMTPRILSKAVG
jgi:hypothetical protein